LKETHFAIDPFERLNKYGAPQDLYPTAVLDYEEEEEEEEEEVVEDGGSEEVVVEEEDMEGEW